MTLSAAEFADAFPFHFAVDGSARVTAVGRSLRILLPEISSGKPLADFLAIERPVATLAPESLRANLGQLFILRSVDQRFRLRGQMMWLERQQVFVFLGSPWLATSDTAASLGLGLNDFAIHDSTADLQQLLEAQASSLEEARTLAMRLKSSNDELRRQIAAVRAAENFARNVVSSVKEVVFTTDADGRLTFLNPSWTEVTGFAIEAALGRRIDEFLMLEGPAAPGQVTWSLPGDGETLRREARCRTHGGGFRWVELLLAGSQDETASRRGAIGTLYDITDRRTVEANLRAAMEEAERASQLKDQFLASMSHELRTPLNAILGLTEGLEERVFGEINARQSESLEHIRESGEHLLALINNILDLSKIAAGRMDLELGPVDVDRSVEAALRLVRPVADPRSVSITVACRGEKPARTIVADELRLRQMLANLVGNAVKFSPDGGAVRVEVVPEPEAGCVALHVLDNGLGIDVEHLNRIFEPFVQVDSKLDRRFEGTGLGLALVKSMAELHGGSIEVRSTLGQGSEFILRLPFTARPPMASHSP